MLEATEGNDDVTRLLNNLCSLNSEVDDQLFPLIYHELRRLARSRMLRERPDHTLQTTALVHEAFLKLSKGKEDRWVNRSHFFAVASEAMKQVLIDHARKRLAKKRDGQRVELNDAMAASDQALDRVLAVNEALERLAVDHPREARVVTLRFFGGLDYSDIAEALNVSERTAKRDWEYAQRWLFAALQEPMVARKTG
jgi:RNA polymerase sigma factor (TIGR02999 family)